ncbi:NAD(P)-dependent oxidoreductase [Rhizobium leguminosarum]|uniref:NAD-dependent epimerase/dehydratase family protein n=1 Tax=Rhizobium leguminosarum TaxID=384 RepID=UPI001C96AADB|nr:NAD(P)-dependent oxidoreductase [Rhizobium leguminosarum]MBY5367028.1 NAD(P)-dependent oxidoreductase [Rhizobium leguminosarum]MBY5449662.1 NAD(P)-dependent oxidoreductase [Rhizobium leguminosarum]
MRVVVTGATGVIGRRVVPILLGAGHRVTALVRPQSERGANVPSGCDVVVASLFEEAPLAKAIVGHEAVINLATHIPKSALGIMFRSAWRENDRIRTEGARNVADAAAKVGAEILVQESFAYAYPDMGAEWIDEAVVLRPAAYCRSILNAEASARAFARGSTRTIILRFAAFYGSDASQTRTMVDGVRKGLATLPGRRSSFISSISHDDAAAAVVAALDAPSGAYNVSDNRPVTHEEFIGVLADALDVSHPRFLPPWTAALMGSAGRTLSRSIKLRNDKLKAATVWKPRSPSIKEGLPAAITASAR